MARTKVGRGWGGVVLVGAGVAWACGVPMVGDEEGACAERLPGDVVITEYLNDPEGTDTGREYVEVHNPTRDAVDLRGLTLYASRSDGSQEHAYVFMGSVTMAPGSYLVLGDAREGPLPAYVDHAYGDALGALGNSSGLLGLRCGARILDEVKLAAPAKSGVARTYDGRLAPDSEGNDDPSRWCDAAGGGTGLPRGSPGEANAPCATPEPVPSDVDGGVTDAGVVETCLAGDAGTPRAVARPRSGELVITEVMANPRGDDTLGEWLEVVATASVDLNGLTVGTDSPGTKLVSSRCVSLGAGGRAVLARRAESALNGGLPTPLATFGVDLRNSGGRVVLRSGDMVVDEVVYGPVEEGVSWQVSSSQEEATRNDALESWCRSVDGHGSRGELGTPGRVNRLCAGDGGTVGGGTDGGASDGGRSDGGAADGGRSDAGASDGGRSDGGSPDAGRSDAGSDAGAPGATCIDRVTGRARAPNPPDTGSLVLTEFMVDPSTVADATGEWVELLALRDVDLNGVTLSSESASSAPLASTLCLTVKAGTRALLARDLDTARNGGLPAVAGTFAFNLVNDAGNHLLRVSWEGRMIDTVTWTAAATPGVSWQLDPARSAAGRNDVAGSFCLAPTSARYGLGDRGTPGTENRSCAK